MHRRDALKLLGLLLLGSSSSTYCGGSGSGTRTGTGTGTKENITSDQLLQLQTNINATIMRLTSSGSTSVLIGQRVNVLQTILQTINSFVKQLQSGTMDANKIPITVTQYRAFLPFVDITKDTQLNEPLPTLIQNMGASGALANLFPFYFNGDVSGAKLAQSLFDKYATSFFKDTSYEVGLKFNHKSETERALAESITKTLMNKLVKPFSNNRETTETQGEAPESDSDRMKWLKFKGLSDGSQEVTSSSSEEISDASSSEPAIFVWKDRAQQICDQIAKRGLEPYDFGCLKDTSEVDENFSFRGYARMVCSRLSTNYDPSIPEMCGCPPPTWAGWRP